MSLDQQPQIAQSSIDGFSASDSETPGSAPGTEPRGDVSGGDVEGSPETGRSASTGDRPSSPTSDDGRIEGSRSRGGGGGEPDTNDGPKVGRGAERLE